MKKIVSNLIVVLLLTSALYAETQPEPVVRDEIAIDKALSWGYQLQGYPHGLTTIKDSRFDLIVMDYSFSGGPEDEFMTEEINNLKFNGPCKRKIVLAYMSIGEAEEFRFYFKDMPEDLLFDKPNPAFPDNIKVRFWDKRWQKIIFGNPADGNDKGYLDRIIDASFDGVYLDIIDAYEFWGTKEIGGNGERVTAARDMVDLVVKIADYARNTRGKTGFIVVPQNGAGIIDPSSYPFADDPESEASVQKERYISTIDAIGAEDTFFFGVRDDDNPLNPQVETIRLLNLFRDAGKKVLAVDYVQDEEKVDKFYELATAEGYIPYATVRDLDSLTINGKHEPVCNDAIAGVVESTPLETDTPVTSSPTEEVSPSPTPTSTPMPIDGKWFTFKCGRKFVIRFGRIEVLPLRVGDVLNCALTLVPGLVDPTGAGMKVATVLKEGAKVSIKVAPAEGVTNEKGELGFTITAIDSGVDWIAWSIPDEGGNMEFDKEAYDNGFAWGVFVEVRE